jgi:hypothetical protein
VMGTTGGDRNKLVKDVEASGVYAVIAPQMGKQVGVVMMILLVSDAIRCASEGMGRVEEEEYYFRFSY